MNEYLIDLEPQIWFCNDKLCSPISRRFFRYFKVNLWDDCPFWETQPTCGRQDCSVWECSEDGKILKLFGNQEKKRERKCVLCELPSLGGNSSNFSPYSIIFLKNILFHRGSSSLESWWRGLNLYEQWCELFLKKKKKKELQNRARY